MFKSHFDFWMVLDSQDGTSEREEENFLLDSPDLNRCYVCLLRA